MLFWMRSKTYMSKTNLQRGTTNSGEQRTFIFVSFRFRSQSIALSGQQSRRQLTNNTLGPRGTLLASVLPSCESIWVYAPWDTHRRTNTRRIHNALAASHRRLRVSYACWLTGRCRYSVKWRTKLRRPRTWWAVLMSTWKVWLCCRRVCGIRKHVSSRQPRAWPPYAYNFSTSLHTHPFNGPLSGTTRVSRYLKGKANLDFTEARDSEWQWHQLDRMQICTSLQTDNHASTPTQFFTGRMPFLPPNRQRQSPEGKNFSTSLLVYYLMNWT